MKKLALTLAVLLLLVAALSGCSQQSLDTIKQKGEIVMLTNAAFPPFEYIDGSTPVGVDVDVATAIAADLGVTLKVVDMDFDGVIAALTSGKGDFVAAGMSITEERKQSVDFSVEYVTSSQYMILPEGSNLATMEDLQGKVIGVQLGTTGDFLIDDAINLEDGELFGSGAELIQYKTALEAAQNLINGKIDAVVIDQYPAMAIAEKNAGVLRVSGEAIAEAESYAIAVAKGNTELLEAINNTLKKLIAEGKVNQFLVDHTTGE